MALVSTEVCTMSGRTPASSSSLPLLTASSTPFGDRPTSTQPVNSPSEFQTLSPCLISTNVAMLESLVAAFRPARRAQRRAASRGAWPGHPRGTECRSPGLISFWRCMPVPRPYPRRIATISVHTSPLEQPGTGDAGGLHVYVVEVAQRLAGRGVGGGHLRPRRLPRPAPGRRARPRGAGAAPGRRPLRGPGQGGPARPALPLHVRGAARRGRLRAGPVRHRARPLLAVRPGRGRGQGTLGRPV